MNFLEKIDAEFLFEILTNPLHRAKFAHVDIVILRLCQESVPFVVVWILTWDESEAVQLVFIILIDRLVVVREVVIAIFEIQLVGRLNFRHGLRNILRRQSASLFLLPFLLPVFVGFLEA